MLQQSTIQEKLLMPGASGCQFRGPRGTTGAMQEAVYASARGDADGDRFGDRGSSVPSVRSFRPSCRRTNRAKWRTRALGSMWIFAAIVLSGPLIGAEPRLERSPPVDFAGQVLPILQQRCHQCHGGVRRESELSLLTRDDALLAGSSGAPAIVPGKPDESELLRRVSSIDEFERMPPTGNPLTHDERQLLSRWLAEGAVWERHWAFKSVARPLPPAVDQQDWVRNSVDRFILQALEAANIPPSPEAGRRTLIRRLYIDLIGLLPSIEETEAFCRDTRGDSYERLVDRLLASPHFGERWGRHWLDQARYADSDGFEVDGPRPFAWRWRDWVIDTFNGDMPFDAFTVQQIAGDLLPSGSANESQMQNLATAFHRQSLTNREGGIDREEARYKELVDRVNAVGTTWLGLTISCAQCHDHPYDPFTQLEYFQLYAFFNRTDDTEIELSTEHTLQVTEKQADPHKIKARVISESEDERTTTVYHRGDFLQPGEPVEPGVLNYLYPCDLGSADDAHLDRMHLARWIVDRRNPLTARVAANQVWSRLFGEGLVRTPSDFGTRGEAPTHPHLLDYLAEEYRAGGWSTKRLIRQIVTSATYRQSSRHRPRFGSLDPRNTLWHRQNRFRVEAELIRDLCLDASGMLSREIGGPSIYPPLAEEVAQLSFRSNYVWPTSTGGDRYRRGMYVFFKRTLPYPSMDTFGCPDATAVSMQRDVSNTPLQALVLLNNEVHVEAARALMRRVLATASSDHDRMDVAFQTCLNRGPTRLERQKMIGLLTLSRDYYRDHRQDAQAIVEGYQPADGELSEAAAWFATLSLILNLDEFLTRE